LDTYVGNNTMMACPTLAARGRICAGFLETKTVGLGLTTGLFCYRRPTVHENSLLAGKLSVDPPVIGSVVCPCDQLPQAIAVGHEID